MNQNLSLSRNSLGKLIASASAPPQCGQKTLSIFGARSSAHNCQAIEIDRGVTKDFRTAFWSRLGSDGNPPSNLHNLRLCGNDP